MTSLSRGLVFAAFILPILSSILGTPAAVAYSGSGQAALQVLVYPNSTVYKHLITYSGSRRVLVIDDSVSPVKFLSFLATGFLKGNNTSIKPLSPSLEKKILERLNALLAAKNLSQGFRVRGLSIWDNGVIWVRVETPRPGGLGEGFGHIVAASVSRIVEEEARVKARAVIVTYAPPRVDEAASAIQELVNTRLASILSNVSHAVGVSVAPLLEVDYRATERVSLKQLADLVEAVIPQDSWALIVVHKVFPRPEPLITSTNSTAPPISHTEGESQAGTTTPRWSSDGSLRSSSHTSGGSHSRTIEGSIASPEHSHAGAWAHRGLVVASLAVSVVSAALLGVLVKRHRWGRRG